MLDDVIGADAVLNSRQYDDRIDNASPSPQARHAVTGGRLPLPDPGTLRRIIRGRKLRERYSGEALFSDPAWDMLLDLTAARIEHQRVSISSLCLASGVPSTTALRWIRQMEQAELIRREDDAIDRRRSYVILTDKAADAMARYFAELGRSASEAI